MILEPVRCVLFDLDGVLIDTCPIVAAALEGVALDLGVSFGSDVDVLAAATLSPRAAVRTLFPGLSRAQSLFNSHLRRAAQGVRPCAGVIELLNALSGERLGVVTSRNGADAAIYLTSAGLQGYFPVVVTWGHTARHKPYPDPLLVAMKRLGAVQGTYVGDTPDDMVAAVAAEFEPIAALWTSRHSTAVLSDAGARFIAIHPREVIAHLTGKES